MKIEIKDNCPINNFEPCKKFDCAWFTHIRGKNPQSNEEVDEFACAIAWIPMLMIENSQMQRQTGAAVESFRNEMVTANKSSQDLMMLAANIKRISHD